MTQTPTPDPLDGFPTQPHEVPTQVQEISRETMDRLEKEFQAAGLEQDVIAAILAKALPVIQALVLRLIGA